MARQTRLVGLDKAEAVLLLQAEATGALIPDQPLGRSTISSSGSRIGYERSAAKGTTVEKRQLPNSVIKRATNVVGNIASKEPDLGGQGPDSLDAEDQGALLYVEVQRQSHKWRICLPDEIALLPEGLQVLLGPIELGAGAI